MGSKPDAWMPFYIGDYMGDTARLSTEQHGAYLLMIFDYWRNGPPADDDEELAEITKLGLDAWKKQRPKIQRFFQISDGVWRHKRIDEEMSVAQANAGRASERASAAAKTRWDRERSTRAASTASSNAYSSASSNARRSPVGNAQEVPEECPSPSPTSVSNETGAAAPPDDLAELRGKPVAAGCWHLALKVLVERGGMEDKPARTFVGKLKGFGLTDEDLWSISEDAWKSGTLDPKPYLVAAAEAASQRRSGQLGILDPSERQQRAWMEDWIEKPFQWKVHERGPRPGQPGCRIRPEIQAEFTEGRAA